MLRVGDECDALVSDGDKPSAGNLGSPDTIVKKLQLEAFCGHLLEDKNSGFDLCYGLS